VRIRPLACLTTALALSVLPACSDDDDVTAPSTASPTASSSAASGESLHVGLIANTTSLEPLKRGAQVAIEAINAAGGVKGRPLELVACDNQLNANAAAACARQMADDPELVATVGSVSSFGGDTNPVLEKAGIAGIGTAPLGSGDFTSPVVFPITPGGQVIVAGAVLLADELKSTKPGVVVVDTPTATALPGLIESSILEPRGLKLAAKASIPVSAADVAPQAAALADTDGVIVSTTTQLMTRYVRTARQQGYDGDVVISGTEASPDSVKTDLSGVNSDLYVVSGFERDSDGFRHMVADIDTYDPDAPLNDTVAAGYLSVKVFADVADGLENIDRSGVLSAMNAMKDFSTDGMTLPLDFTTPGTALGGNAPRLFDHAAIGYAYRFENDNFVPVGARPLRIYKSN
jgi:branched-chain amino acid transport system substrate-binding protein